MKRLVESLASTPELKESAPSKLIIFLYRIRILRSACVRIALQREGGEMTSQTVRRILAKYHGVQVGEYSYGECMKPGRFPAGVVVGRYVSIATGVKVFRRNHPVDRLSTHPYFYNSRLGWISRDNISDGPQLFIGHDAWIGANAIITPSCNRIGVGAIVGAGAVVTSDVPDFAVVVGVPARVVRYRFSPEIQSRVLQGKWWQLNVHAVMTHLEIMTMPAIQVPDWHPLFSPTTGSTQERHE